MRIKAKERKMMRKAKERRKMMKAKKKRMKAWKTKMMRVKDCLKIGDCKELLSREYNFSKRQPVARTATTRSTLTTPDSRRWWCIKKKYVVKRT